MKKKILEYIAWFLILMLFVSTIRNIGRVRRVRSEIRKEQEKVERVRKENGDLERRVAETQGAEFIEAEVRNKLGLVKEGETVVILPDEETLKKLAPRAYTETETLPDPNWRKWLKLFF
ncbi:MAG: Septum formation initiator [Candidatus Woesebacteria bacterium GW2011_GWB1_45_5]|uniref:Septum formation initiator n=1 Tax=Candidatus Woesebacteria bacterium GW2011_GWB1_45_5 TaxID=1618581 RepID=A0A0G1MQG8_9BACT|nr:MAG: Septum formation initiator [Candidatus Woesebacteria bacterium GW2011_GWB1_45_5]